MQLADSWYRLKVLSQGWTPSSTISHTASAFIAAAGEYIAAQQSVQVKILPWIDNYHTVSLSRDSDAIQHVFNSITQTLGLVFKPWEQEPPSVLNLQLKLIDQGYFRVSPTWCQERLPVIQCRIQRQHLSLRRTWTALGCVIYHTHTSLRPLYTLRHSIAWMSAASRQYSVSLEPSEIPWSTKVQIPLGMRTELHSALGHLQQSSWIPMYRPAYPPAIHASHILICDASPTGYGFLYRPPASDHWLACSRLWPPITQTYFPTVAELDKQFHREIWGLHLAMQEIFGDWTVIHTGSIFIITDVSGIARSMHRKYTSSPLLMDIIVHLEHATSGTNISLTCSWGPGGDRMPADPLSRARIHSTKWHTHHDQAIVNMDLETYIQNSYDWYCTEHQLHP
jgi:hypothetical protein